MFLVGVKNGTATGNDAIPSELLQAGASARAVRLARLMEMVSNEGTALMWKGGDIAAVLGNLGPIATANVGELLCSSVLAGWLHVR